MEHNQELVAKLSEELKKFNDLYDEALELKEKLAVADAMLEETLKKIDE